MALLVSCLFGFCFCVLKKWPEDSFYGFLQSIVCNANVCVELWSYTGFAEEIFQSSAVLDNTMKR